MPTSAKHKKRATSELLFYTTSPQTSKHVGANVEGYLEADMIIHNFALSKRQKQSLTTETNY